MAVGRTGNKIQEKIQMCVWGRQGSGKSYLSTTAMFLKRPDGKPMRVLCIDSEQGSADSIYNELADKGVDLRNLYIVYTSDSEEVMGLIKKAKTTEPYYEYDENGNEDYSKIVRDADGDQFRPDFIIVDGTTVIKQVKELARLKFSEKRAAVRAEKQGLTGQAKAVAIEGSDLEQKDYKEIAFEGRNLVTALRECGKHYLITARAKAKKKYELVNGQQVGVDTGEDEIDSFKDIGYNVDTVIHMVEETGDFGSTYYGIIEEKDRSHVYKVGDKIENISLTAWQKIIDKGNGLNAIKFIDNEKQSVVKEADKLVETATANAKVDGLSNGNPTDELQALKEKVATKLRSMTPEEKGQLKVKVAQAQLSPNVSGYTSVDELQKLYDVICK